MCLAPGFLSKRISTKKHYCFKGAINFPDPIKQAFSWPTTGRNLSSEIQLCFLLTRIFIDFIKYFQRNHTNLLSKKITNRFTSSKQTNQDNAIEPLRGAESNSSYLILVINGFFPVRTLCTSSIADCQNHPF